MVSQYTSLVKFDDIPGGLPRAQVPENIDLGDIAQDAVRKVNKLQPSHLTTNAIWRDLLALTGTYRTIYSRHLVYSSLAKLSKERSRSIFHTKDEHPPRITKSGKESSWVDVDLVFFAQHYNMTETCRGTVSVVFDAEKSEWKVWMLRTWLECFDGYGHPDVLAPTSGLTNGVSKDASNFEDLGAKGYGAIIVGGGQAGLSTAGRLQALGVKYLLLERHSQVGDQWRNRYESLRWHTSKEIGNLPFERTFFPEDDYMLPTKRIADGQQAWSDRYALNVKTNTTVDSATWDEITQRWVVETTSNTSSESFRAKNLILAIGPGHGTPTYPTWATPEKAKESGFEGTLVHAFDGYHSAQAWTGKRGIVVGTANTAHDIAEDMANADMTTTMVQRSPTFIFPAEWLHAAEDVHYHADMPTSEADRETFTYPNKIMREIVNRGVWAGIQANPERFDALEAAGFKIDRYGDIYNNLFIRFGGHYVDIGCSARIAKGEIKVKTGALERLTATGLRFKDGSEVEADLIVLCTGFDKVFRNDAARILGKEMADRIDEFWGTDAEGELRGYAKPAGHPHLYYHGGDIRNARFFSRFIALQVQADVLGKPLAAYTE